jgi:hypothetical protein
MKQPPFGSVQACLGKLNMVNGLSCALPEQAAQVLRSLIELSRPHTAARIVAEVTNQGRVGFVRDIALQLVRQVGCALPLGKLQCY